MTKSKIQSKIGENIRIARQRMELTQNDVAKKADVSVNYYARIERGEVNPSVDTLKAIFSVLNVKSSDILPF